MPELQKIFPGRKWSEFNTATCATYTCYKNLKMYERNNTINEMYPYYYFNLGKLDIIPLKKFFAISVYTC